MALTDQPYLPLYVDDWMNNNKLKMCSPSAHGLMIVIICIMHKETEYGTILLKQKFRQTSRQIKNFALQIAKLSPFDSAAIEDPLNELLSEGALTIIDDYLICPRMVKDCQKSKAKADAGKIGGAITQKKKAFDKAKLQAKCVSNSGIDTDNGIESESVIENGLVTDEGKGGAGEKPNLIYPFESENFLNQWSVWQTYLGEQHEFEYLAETTEQAALIDLANLSKHDETTAITIMHQSMANGWKGFFEVKQQYGSTKQPSAKGVAGYSDNFKRKIAERLQSG
jgi:hypothetical protein